MKYDFDQIIDRRGTSCLKYDFAVERGKREDVLLDLRELGLTEAEREDLIVNKAKLWLDSGAIFGEDGEGFERINIACPRAFFMWMA